MGFENINKIGIKNTVSNNGIKIFGNPHLKISKKVIIKNFLKDHRVFMTSVIAALSFGGKWEIQMLIAFVPLFPHF